MNDSTKITYPSDKPFVGFCATTRKTHEPGDKVELYRVTGNSVDYTPEDLKFRQAIEDDKDGAAPPAPGVFSLPLFLAISAALILIAAAVIAIHQAVR